MCMLQVFECLLDNCVLSAPVWDEVTSEYCGFLDLRDLVSYIVYEWDRVLRRKLLRFSQVSGCTSLPYVIVRIQIRTVTIRNKNPA